MYCKICGKVVPDGTDYCRNCAEEIPSVGFIEAAKLFFSNYGNFSGRARRSEYWLASLFTAIVSGILTAVLPMLTGIWSLLIFVPSLSISIRRLHDIGKSGWWYLMAFVPLVGQIMILVWACTDSKEANQWGPNPKYRVVRKAASADIIVSDTWPPEEQPSFESKPAAFEPNPAPAVLPPVGGATKPLAEENAFPLTTAPSHSMPDNYVMPKPQGPTTPAFSVTLILCTGPAAGRQFTFQAGQKITFGRAQPGPHNAVLANYDKVSGTHCLLDVGGSGLSVMDLGSTNGTIINGQRLMPQVSTPVPHGGVIFLADNNCVFQVKYNK